MPSHRARESGKTVRASLTRDLALLSAAGNYLDFQFRKVKPFIGRRVLEVGAGVGSHTAKLLSLGPEIVWANEIEPSFCLNLQKRFGARINIIEGDILDVLETRGAELCRQRFDTVILLNVLEHLKDDLHCLVRLRDLIAPGGRLVLLLPAHQFLFSELDRAYGHFRRYDQATAKSYAHKLGMRLAHSRYFNVIGFLGWLVYARCFKATSIHTGSMGLFDSILPHVQVLEDRLPCPFGLSLLVVLEK